jgi:DNA repair exonuclease SbcCD ATPase subunit
MFSEVLSAADIKKIAEGGLCADLEEFEETRVLRWEDILDRSRSGSVTESDTGCKQMLVFRQSLYALLNETKINLEATNGKLEATEGKLEAAEGKLETVSTELNQTKDALKSTLEELGTVRGELEGARKFDNITRWDVLYTAPYFNKVFTEELYEQLTSSWHLLREFTFKLLEVKS